MSATSAPLTDSRIMLRRNLKHIRRNPVTIFNGTLMPVVIMLLFVYVLGNAFNVGEHYIEYATPGLIILAISYGLSAWLWSFSLYETQDGDWPGRVACRPSPSGRGAGEPG